MNFLRNFLQGKEGAQKNISDIPNSKDSKDDLYPLSRSATDPSASSSPNLRAKRQNVAQASSDDPSLSASGEPSGEPPLKLSPSNERRVETSQLSQLSLEETNYLQRPSFKVEGVLSRHVDSELKEEAKDQHSSNPGCGQTDPRCEFNSTFTEPKNPEFFDCAEEPSIPSKEPLPQLGGTGEPSSPPEPDSSVCPAVPPLKTLVSEVVSQGEGSTKEESVSEVADVVLPDGNTTTVSSILPSDNAAVNLSEQTEPVSEPNNPLDLPPPCDLPSKDQPNPNQTPSSEVEPTPEGVEDVCKEESVLQHEEPSVETGSELTAGDRSGYLEFTFEDAKKPLKPPPRALGKRFQPSAKRRRSKNRSKSNKGAQPQTLEPQSTSEPNSETPKKEESETPCNNESSEKSVTDSASPLCSPEEGVIDIVQTNSSEKVDLDEKPLPQAPPTELASNTEENLVPAKEELISPREEGSTLSQPSSAVPVHEQTPSQEPAEDNLETLNEVNLTEINTSQNPAVDFQLESHCDTATASTCEPPLPRVIGNSDNGSCSIISISCYGNEEFEILGNEANKLVEELTDTVEAPNMEEQSPTENCSSLLTSRESSSKAVANDNEFENKKDNFILQVGDSEAGPEIATGLTSSDLKCASQFFREAAELESQIRRNIGCSIGSLNDFVSEGERSSFTPEHEDYNSNRKSGPPPSSPPHEERSAPEGTSSPDPRSLEDSEVRNRMHRSPVGSSSHEVNELLKKQALEFEEKLLRQGIVAAEKEKELHELLKEEQKQMEKVTSANDALLKLVEQYKGMLAALVSEKDKANTAQEEKLRTAQAEKQQAVEDLGNVEAAFSDVHRKYERTKQIVDSLRRNEETLRNAVADYEQKLLKQERKFAELQRLAEEKVKLANEELEGLRRSNDQEMTRMGALLKKAEMKIISLQEALERKCRENQELTQLCDDLISKVGS